MAKLNGLVISNSAPWVVEQKIDLAEIFGDRSFSQSFRERVGQAMIDYMLERIEKEKGNNGRSYSATAGKYSDEYAKSDEFRAYGKSKNDVTLRQSGEMLNLLTIKDQDETSVTLGWSDVENNAKAHGHMTGFNGKASDKKRLFFGLNRKELESIAVEFSEDLNNESDDIDTQNADSLNALEILRNDTLEQTTNQNDSLFNFFLGQADDTF